MKTMNLIFLSFLLLLSCNNEKVKTKLEKEIQGKVIKIKDGDTIDILFDGKPLTIRFAHVDCPEKKQPFGTVAKQFTADKCFRQVVTIQNENKYDRNKRLIGVVINEEGENVNKELLKAGLAWHYKKYSTDNSYSELEVIARESKVGLWVDNNVIPPWDWRNP